MRTRREQVQAHRFIVRRIISAMLSGEPETLDLPMRRLAIAAVASTAIAALVFAGFWVVGLVWPGGAESWKVDGAIIVEEETGARFVYWDGLLHPVQNYASALLITSSGDRTVFTVHQSSLADTPRGGMLGIPGAPDALPENDRFVGMPLLTCSAPNRLDALKRDSHVVVGMMPGGGESLGDKGLLLESDGDYHLVIGDTKFLVPGEKTLPALGADVEQVVSVDRVLINALFTGPELVVPVPDAGDPGRELDGEDYEIGELFINNDRYYVLLDDGLAPIGELAAELIGTPRTEISTAAVSENQSDSTVEPAGFPTDRPEIVSGLRADVSAVCGVYEDGELRVEYFPTSPSELQENTMLAPDGTADEVTTADHVLLPGGYGALFRAEITPGAAGGTVFLLTDQGWKFGMTDETLEAFGYKGVEPVPVPASLLDLVPTGPELSQASALGFTQ
ncbi:type VII secretion protein EccB [Stackebrandtia albiflava]|uniref:Type VII secretion protein EccB n=1 Tax=Stackebrandtia albiflava TaxID=406432 RepID=A0A562V3T1_9ACTN|nr:type VII secretion protein EccB [Stackebrandtia albiflava]TWJ12515.1 type VII secretion protein EccB [Stackebrandtia albiflava]